MCDPTVQKFLEATTLDPPMVGKRLRIDLAGPSGVSPIKGGQKHGWRKPLPGDAVDGRCSRTRGGGYGHDASQDWLAPHFRGKLSGLTIQMIGPRSDSRQQSP